MQNLLETLRTQRWDDHRYYHQCRINQSLHLVSALSFLAAYVYLFIDPVVSGLVGWLVSMTTRQTGHFFFEPTGYDHINQTTFEHKEAIKVGYNLRRKVVLIAVCLAVPLSAWLAPDVLAIFVPEGYEDTKLRMIGMAWLLLGLAGLLFRVAQLWVQQGLLAGIAWALKIISDPVHDILLYYRAPLYLLKGQRLDPMEHVRAATH